jgi:7-cyano-7-deazaguanine synthase
VIRRKVARQMTHPSQVAATVLMSGGIDSTACAHFLLGQGIAATGLFIDHGQAAAVCEARAVDAIASRFGIQVDQYFLGGSQGSVLGAGELVGRNAMLIFTALFLTRARPGLLAIGVHAGTPYFDCSRSFVDTAARLVADHTDGRVRLVAPFIEWSKKDIFDYSKGEALPIELTYSCEAGTEPVCGLCASCLDRQALA